VSRDRIEAKIIPQSKVSPPREILQVSCYSILYYIPRRSPKPAAGNANCSGLGHKAKV
jgi:hypothetical protein